MLFSRTFAENTSGQNSSTRQERFTHPSPKSLFLRHVTSTSHPGSVPPRSHPSTFVANGYGEWRGVPMEARAGGDSVIHLHDFPGRCHPGLWQTVISEALALKLGRLFLEWMTGRRKAKMIWCLRANALIAFMRHTLQTGVPLTDGWRSQTEWQCTHWGLPFWLIKK